MKRENDRKITKGGRKEKFDCVIHVIRKLSENLSKNLLKTRMTSRLNYYWKCNRSEKIVLRKLMMSIDTSCLIFL